MCAKMSIVLARRRSVIGCASIVKCILINYFMWQLLVLVAYALLDWPIPVIKSPVENSARARRQVVYDTNPWSTNNFAAPSFPSSSSSDQTFSNLSSSTTNNRGFSSSAFGSNERRSSLQRQQQQQQQQSPTSATRLASFDSNNNNNIWDGLYEGSGQQQQPSNTFRQPSPSTNNHQESSRVQQRQPVVDIQTKSASGIGQQSMMNSYNNNRNPVSSNFPSGRQSPSAPSPWGQSPTTAEGNEDEEEDWDNAEGSGDIAHETVPDDTNLLYYQTTSTSTSTTTSTTQSSLLLPANNFGERYDPSSYRSGYPEQQNKNSNQYWDESRTKSTTSPAISKDQWSHQDTTFTDSSIPDDGYDTAGIRPQEFPSNSVMVESTTQTSNDSSTTPYVYQSTSSTGVVDSNIKSFNGFVLGQLDLFWDKLMDEPALLSCVIGGAVIGLLIVVLFAMFLIYRMRKKDEGSYALDDSVGYRKAAGYMRAPTSDITAKEYYA